MIAIGILGTGTWGMALARLLANGGHDVTAWSVIPEEIEQLSTTRRHPNLPGMVIPEAIHLTNALSDVCEGKDLVVFAVPSVYVRETARLAAPWLPDHSILVDAAKGIESNTLMTLTEVIAEEMAAVGKTARLVALSGPTHAEEVAMDGMTSIVAASSDEEAAMFVQDIFMTPFMRVYTNPDVRGVEISGALKNVIALASGISTGLGYGDNARAALITRGMAEIARLGEAMGCDRATFSGLTGIGDLVVTCTSAHSRNNRCGILIGQGCSAAEATQRVGMVVEGLNALPAAMALAERYGVEMPITFAVNAVVHEGCAPRDAVSQLMQREKKPENSL